MSALGLSAGQNTSRKPKKHVTTACLRCRKLRAKCDGELPCNTCSSKNQKCEYDQRQDGRMSRKRPHDENTTTEMLHTIVESMRTNNARSNEELLNLIRSGAKTPEIAQRATEISGRAENSLKRPRGATDEDTAADEPVVRVPAQPWTTVTKDDDAVSHLFSIYLIWQHSTYPAFDPDILIPETALKQPSSLYCSKFLMNAILASACMFTDHPITLSNPSDPSTRGAHFLQEAIKLWEVEEGSATLTNLQGLIMLIVSLVCQGKDRVALLYASQLNTLRQNLYSKIRLARKTESHDFNTAGFQRSWSYAAWASFKIEVEMTMAWRTSLNITKPTVPRPWPKEQLEARNVWRPYPIDEPEITFNPRINDDAGFSLYEIGVDICSILLSGNPQDSPLPGHIILESSERLARAYQIEEDLLAWQDEQLSVPIAMEKLLFPHLAGPAMDVQLTYNVWRIVVNSIIHQEPSAPQTDRDHAGENVVSACKSIANFLYYGHNTWGTSRYSCYVAHASIMGASNLIDHLSRPGIPETFHTMVVSLTAVGSRWTLFRGITRSLWLTINERKLEGLLLGTTVSLLKLNAVDKWGPEDHRLFESCTYPNYATSSNDGRDVDAIGDLLARYAKLDLDGEDQSGPHKPS